MDSISRFKHWHIFVLLILPIAANIAFSMVQFDNGNLSSKVLKALSGVFGVTIIFIWILSIGLTLIKYPKNPYKLNKTMLILSTIFCIVGYSILHIMPLLIEEMPDSNIYIALITPLTFFSIIYIFYNIPRSLKASEIGQKVVFRVWIIDAFLMFFSPIGVWIIQPKVNYYSNLNYKTYRQQQV